MTTIEKIKAEIERLKSIEYPCDNSQQATGFFNALDRMTDFLSILESEKPMNQDGLEKEAVNYCFDNGLNLSPRVATDFARHFSEWQAEQMMKEAVEGEVRHYATVHYVITNESQLSARLKQFQDGDKVCIIIVKED